MHHLLSHQVETLGQHPILPHPRPPSGTLPWDFPQWSIDCTHVALQTCTKEHKLILTNHCHHNSCLVSSPGESHPFNSSSCRSIFSLFLSNGFMHMSFYFFYLKDTLWECKSWGNNAAPPWEWLCPVWIKCKVEAALEGNGGLFTRLWTLGIWVMQTSWKLKGLLSWKPGGELMLLKWEERDDYFEMSKEADTELK